VISPALAEQATPAERDRVIDFVRVASIATVIIGHWLMATVTYDNGTPVGANVLTALPALHPATWLFQVMPLFFVAGGFANYTVWRKAGRDGGGYSAYGRYLDRRLRRLLRPTVAFIIAIPIVLICLGVVGVGAPERELVAGILSQPLWFLGVFIMATALAPILARAHERSPRGTMAALLLAAVAIDVLRMVWVSEIGYVNGVVAWLFVQQLGFWYADGFLLQLRHSTLWIVVVGSVAALVGLTGPGPYPVSMVGLPGQQSNMTPPSVCLLILAIGQVAAVLLARRRLASWLHEPRPWLVVVTAGSMAMSLYLWHLVVLVAGLGFLVAWGLPVPEPGSLLWWISRPLWVIVLGVVLLPLAAVLSRLERSSPAASNAALESGRHATVAIVGTCLAVIGLFGLVLGGFAPSVVTALNVVAVAIGFAFSRHVAPRPLTPV
jgi:peptidoglycan/LPS O-acetylase OafA/YrhL